MDSVMTISPHNSGQLIQLAQIDADETFAVVSAGIGRGLRRGAGAAGLGLAVVFCSGGSGAEAFCSAGSACGAGAGMELDCGRSKA